jgi:hypothetical protein
MFLISILLPKRRLKIKRGHILKGAGVAKELK